MATRPTSTPTTPTPPTVPQPEDVLPEGLGQQQPTAAQPRPVLPETLGRSPSPTTSGPSSTDLVNAALGNGTRPTPAPPGTPRVSAYQQSAPSFQVAGPQMPTNPNALPSAYSGYYANMPRTQVLPTFLQNTQNALPNPNQIVARNWYRMDPDSQKFHLGAYEAQGYSPDYVNHVLRNLLPGRAAVPTGFGGGRIRM